MVFTVCGDVAQDFGLGGVSWRLKPHQQLQSPPSRTNPPSRRRSASHGLMRFQSQPTVAVRGFCRSWSKATGSRANNCKVHLRGLFRPSRRRSALHGLRRFQSLPTVAVRGFCRSWSKATGSRTNNCEVHLRGLFHPSRRRSASHGLRRFQSPTHPPAPATAAAPRTVPDQAH